MNRNQLIKNNDTVETTAKIEVNIKEELPLNEISSFQRSDYWIRESLATKVVSLKIDLPISVKMVEEYFNDGDGDSDIYQKCKCFVATIKSTIKPSRKSRYSLIKNYPFPPVKSKTFYSMFEPTEEEISLFDKTTVIDVILGYGKNPDTGKLSFVRKVVGFVLKDGTRHILQGESLPLHKFGDRSIDYGVYRRNGRPTFIEMEAIENNRYEAVYGDCFDVEIDYAEECSGEVDEMIEYGAQFSWMD